MFWSKKRAKVGERDRGLWAGSLACLREKVERLETIVVAFDEFGRKLDGLRVVRVGKENDGAGTGSGGAGGLAGKNDLASEQMESLRKLAIEWHVNSVNDFSSARANREQAAKLHEAEIGVLREIAGSLRSVAATHRSLCGDGDGEKVKPAGPRGRMARRTRP